MNRKRNLKILFLENRNRKYISRLPHTFDHSEVRHSVGQSIMLHCFRSVGGGCGHMLFGTIAVFPSVTSCIQLTSRIWSPMPQLCEHGMKSLTFHRGGHGWSLHVCVNTSGWSLREHKYGETIFLSSSRVHSTNDSCTPEHRTQDFH